MVKIDDDTIEHYRLGLAGARQNLKIAEKEYKDLKASVREVTLAIYCFETGIYQGDKITITREPRTDLAVLRNPPPLVSHGFAEIRYEYGSGKMYYRVMKKDGSPGKQIQHIYDTRNTKVTLYVENN